MLKTKPFRCLLNVLKMTTVVRCAGAEYIGAGTGSLIIQVVIASSLGGLVALRLYWNKIKAFFFRKKGEEEPQSPTEADSE